MWGDGDGCGGRVLDVWGVRWVWGEGDGCGGGGVDSNSVCSGCLLFLHSWDMSVAGGPASTAYR